MLGSSGQLTDIKILGEVMDSLALHLPTLTPIMQGPAFLLSFLQAFNFIYLYGILLSC
jgi:hypothetical protein